MSTITIGADVDLKTNSKALKIDTLNHYSNDTGNASAWIDSNSFSGYTENAVNSEYPLTGALAALATYAATVGPSTDVSGLVSESELSYKSITGGWTLGDDSNDHGLYLKLFNSTTSGVKDTFEVMQKNSSGGDTSLFKIECEAAP